MEADTASQVDARLQPTETRLQHVGALDGLRGLAVAAVLLYHGGAEWMRGGFLGVSTFFTLSGFLIARLMHEEMRHTGRLNMRHFWTRRARRLLPAALLTLAAIIVFRGAFGAIAYDRLRGDVLAALAYVENWWLVHTDQAYGAIFATASPVQHFWSLAIEEQFYLVFPLVCYLVVRVVRGTKSVATVFGVCAIVSFLSAAWLARNGDITRAYYGTGARAGELLVGVVLAYVVADGGPEWLRRFGRACSVAGAVGLAILVVLWWRIDLGSVFLFRGGTALNALCTAAVIVACFQSGFVTKVLSFRPLRLLGLISYGVYLVHWPIFLWLTPDRVSTDGVALFAVRIVVTLVVAVAMFVLIERPIRSRTLLRGRVFGVVMIAATACIAAAAILVGSSSSALVVDVASAPSPSREVNGFATPTPPGAKRVLVVGDSLAWTVFVGLQEWGTQHQVQAGNYTVVGCGAGGEGTLDYLGVKKHTSADCKQWRDELPGVVAKYKPDTVLVVMGLADLSPRQFPDGQLRSVGNPTFDRWFSTRVADLTRTLGADGAHVVWATYPDVNVKEVPGATGSLPFPENDPAASNV